MKLYYTSELWSYPFLFILFSIDNSVIYKLIFRDTWDTLNGELDRHLVPVVENTSLSHHLIFRDTWDTSDGEPDRHLDPVSQSPRPVSRRSRRWCFSPAKGSQVSLNMSEHLIQQPSCPRADIHRHDYAHALITMQSRRFNKIIMSAVGLPRLCGSSSNPFILGNNAEVRESGLIEANYPPLRRQT